MDEWPIVQCPECGHGGLQPELKTVEHGQSLKAHDHEDWEPDWISGVFHGVLVCQEARCGKAVAVSGDYAVMWTDRNGPDNYVRLRAATPPLLLMDLPSTTPDEIQQSVQQASAVIWCDPSSAGSRLRVTVERVLDAQGIRKTQTIKSKRVRLTTHRRIEALKTLRPEVAELLLAVKWIGNSGSHSDKLGLEDVLTGAKLLEHAIKLLYDPTPAGLRAMAKRINRKRRI